MSSISDAYLQFITASFSVYLLPTLSRHESAKTDITREIGKSAQIRPPAVAAASLTVCAARFAIWLLFSDRFTAMHDLFAWQLVGDVLKVAPTSMAIW